VGAAEGGKQRTEDGRQKTENADPSSVLGSPSSVVVLFFLPQLLQWFGFVLLPIPFFFLLKKNN